MTAVVTGAGGFIGFALAKRLLEAGGTVFAVGRNREKMLPLAEFGDFTPIVADFADYERLEAKVPSLAGGVFFHFAWQGTSTKTYNDMGVQEVNLRATRLACRAAVNLGCEKIVFPGTYYQYACPIAGETDRSFTPSAYSVVKNKLASFFAEAPVKNTTLIFPHVFGPGGKPESASVIFLRKMLKNESLDLISGERPDDWVFIDDLVDGIIAAAEMERPSPLYYVGHTQFSTFKQNLLTIKRVLGSESSLNFGKYPETSFIDWSKIDTQALFRDTGYTPATGFEEAILKTAEWVKTGVSFSREAA